MRDKGKYAQYVNRLTLSQDIYISFLLGRVCTPNLMFDDQVCRAPLWTEFFLAYAGGTGVGVPTLAEVPKNDSNLLWYGNGRHATVSRSSFEAKSST